MTDANAKQIAGSHYQSQYQHWDLVVDTGMHYLVANATKYISRWRKKNGLQDLEKASHYIQKMIECVAENRIVPVYVSWSEKIKAEEDAQSWVMYQAYERFIDAQELGDQEAAVVHLCSTWTKIENLQAAQAVLVKMIEEVRSQVC